MVSMIVVNGFLFLLEIYIGFYNDAYRKSGLYWPTIGKRHFRMGNRTIRSKEVDDFCEYSAHYRLDAFVLCSIASGTVCCRRFDWIRNWPDGGTDFDLCR